MLGLVSLQFMFRFLYLLQVANHIAGFVAAIDDGQEKHGSQVG